MIFYTENGLKSNFLNYTAKSPVPNAKHGPIIAVSAYIMVKDALPVELGVLRLRFFSYAKKNDFQAKTITKIIYFWARHIKIAYPKPKSLYGIL